MSNKLSQWLKDPVVEYPCNKYNGQLHESFYYTEKEQLKLKHGLIKKNTRHNDINILFTQLVDYCHNNGIKDVDDNPIVNASMKRAFIGFVYENSKK